MKVFGGALALMLLVAGVACGSDEKKAAEPAPAQTTSTRPPSAAVPFYQLVGVDQVSTPERVRYQGNVVMAQDLNFDQIVVVFTDAARRVLRERPNAEAIVLYGYSTMDTAGPYNMGRAWASRDGKGWSGDGRFETGADGDLIHITVGGLTDQDREDVTVKR